MERLTKYQKALKAASFILIKNGEVSLKDIEALPFMDKNFDVQIISSALQQMFDIEVINKRTNTSQYLEWDSILRLTKNPSRSQKDAAFNLKNVNATI